MWVISGGTYYLLVEALVWSEGPPPSVDAYFFEMDWDTIIATRAVFRRATASPPPSTDPFAEEGSEDE